MPRAKELETPEVLELIKMVLETDAPWPSELEEEVIAYGDDNEGLPLSKTLTLNFVGGGDVSLVAFDGRGYAALRFRSASGGGHSPRVSRALLILGLAAFLDNKEYPQEQAAE